MWYDVFQRGSRRRLPYFFLFRGLYLNSYGFFSTRNLVEHSSLDEFACTIVSRGVMPVTRQGVFNIIDSFFNKLNFAGSFCYFLEVAFVEEDSFRIGNPQLRELLEELDLLDFFFINSSGDLRVSRIYLFVSSLFGDEVLLFRQLGFFFRDQLPIIGLGCFLFSRVPEQDFINYMYDYLLGNKSSNLDFVIGSERHCSTWDDFITDLTLAGLEHRLAVIFVTSTRYKDIDWRLGSTIFSYNHLVLLYLSCMGSKVYYGDVFEITPTFYLNYKYSILDLFNFSGYCRMCKLLEKQFPIQFSLSDCDSRVGRRFFKEPIPDSWLLSYSNIEISTFLIKFSNGIYNIYYNQFLSFETVPALKNAKILFCIEGEFELFRESLSKEGRTGDTVSRVFPFLAGFSLSSRVNFARLFRGQEVYIEHGALFLVVVARDKLRFFSPFVPCLVYNLGSDQVICLFEDYLGTGELKQRLERLVGLNALSALVSYNERRDLLLKSSSLFYDPIQFTNEFMLFCSRVKEFEILFSLFFSDSEEQLINGDSFFKIFKEELVKLIYLCNLDYMEYFNLSQVSSSDLISGLEDASLG